MSEFRIIESGSNRGAEVIEHEIYLYTKHQARYGKQEWRCKKSRNCPGRIYTDLNYKAKFQVFVKSTVKGQWLNGLI